MRRILYWLPPVALVAALAAACSSGSGTTSSTSSAPVSSPAAPVSTARCNNNDAPYLPAEMQTASGTDTLNVAQCQIIGAPDRDTRWILGKTVVVRIASVAPNGLHLSNGTLWLNQSVVPGHNVSVAPHLSVNSAGTGLTLTDTWPGATGTCDFKVTAAQGTIQVEASSGLLTFSVPSTTATVNWNCPN